MPPSLDTTSIRALVETQLRGAGVTIAPLDSTDASEGRVVAMIDVVATRSPEGDANGYVYTINLLVRRWSVTVNDSVRFLPIAWEIQSFAVGANSATVANTARALLVRQSLALARQIHAPER